MLKSKKSTTQKSKQGSKQHWDDEINGIFHNIVTMLHWQNVE